MTSQAGATRLMGIDLAWQSERNASAIAAGTLVDGSLHVDSVSIAVVGLDKVRAHVRSEPHLAGVAIDAPLIIDNGVGSRPCEKELTATYASRKAGCHPSNRSLYPDAASVRLGNWLLQRGYKHLGDPTRGAWQIECYPHPALIELFSLAERLAYKKGNVNDRRCGQAALARHIKALEDSAVLSFHTGPECEELLDEECIYKLRGRALKHNEDGLDALVCLYIAALYQARRPSRAFGNRESGYIVVPVGSVL